MNTVIGLLRPSARLMRPQSSPPAPSAAIFGAHAAPKHRRGQRLRMAADNFSGPANWGPDGPPVTVSTGSQFFSREKRSEDEEFDNTIEFDREAYLEYAEIVRMEEFDIEESLAHLQGIEAKAVQKDNFGVAGQLQQGIWRLQELQREVTEWREKELVAVEEGDYSEAASSVRRIRVLLDEYESLKNLEIWAESAAALGEEAPVQVPVRFALRMPNTPNPGDSVVVVGSTEALGEWDTADAHPLQWAGTQWTAELNFPPLSTFEYKFVLQTNNGVFWQDGPNRRVEVPPLGSYGLDVLGNWTAGSSDDIGWFCEPCDELLSVEGASAEEASASA